MKSARLCGRALRGMLLQVRWFILLSLCSSILVSSSLASPKVKLRFKELKPGLKFASSSIFEVVERPWKGAQVEKGQTTDTLYVRSVTKLGKKGLVVRRKLIGSDDNYSDSVTIIDDRGRALAEKEDKRFRQSRIHLELPEEPVGQGDMWAYSVPPSTFFPSATTMTCQVIELKETAGEPIATIVAQTRSDVVFEEGLCRGSIRFKSKLFFDVSRGYVAESSTKTRYMLKYDKVIPKRNKMSVVTIKSRVKQLP